MARGACTTADPEMFHSELYQTMVAAKAHCVGCPVIVDCLDFALARWYYGPGEDPVFDAIGRYGVWGGTLPSERERIIRAGLVAA